MKRRDFLTYTAGFAGILAAKVSRADIPPCPPPLDGSTTICPDDNPPLDGAPSWFTNAAENAWFQVPASNVSANVGATTGGYQGYTGAGVDQQRKEYVLTCCGGHTNGSDNGVYALQLNRETPAWIRLVESTAVVDQNDTGNTGDASYASDGNPRSVHQWNAAGLPVGDNIWLGNMTGQYYNGREGSQVWSLNRAAITNPPVSAAAAPWTYHGRGCPNPVPPEYTMEGGSVAYDPDTGLLWTNVAASKITGAYPIWSIDTANGDIQQYPTWAGNKFPKSGSSNWLRRTSSTIIESQWILMSPSSTDIYRIDLTNTGAGCQIVAESGSRPDLSAVAAHYHPPTNRIYVYKPSFGSTMYALEVPTDVQNGTYNWTSFTIGGTPPAQGETSGWYSHFNIVQDMGNGQGALLTNNSTSGATYMYKLPTS